MPRASRSRILSGAAAALLSACVQSQEFPAPEAAGGADPPAGSLPPPACGTLDDPDNCGACGRSCLGGTCARGQCQPVILAEGQTFSNDTMRPEALGADATHVTWVSGQRAARVPIRGGAVEELGTYPVSPEKLRVVGEHVYMMGGARDAIVRFPKSGGPLEKVTPAIPGVSTIQTFDVVDGAVAWSALRQNEEGVWQARLFLCSIPCTQPEEPWVGEELSPRAIGRSSANLYASYSWSSDARGEGVDCLTAKYKPALVTNVFNEVVVEETQADALAYGAGMGAIARARLPVSRPEGNQPYVPDKVLASDPEMMPRSLSLVESDLYWVDSKPAAPGSIFRVDKGGASLPEVILSGWSPIVLTASQEAIFFTTMDGKVAKLARPIPIPAPAPDEQH